MIIQNIKFRRFIITIQLLAGVSLLTLSYLTTEKEWGNELLNAMMGSEQFEATNGFRELKTSCE